MITSNCNTHWLETGLSRSEVSSVSIPSFMGGCTASSADDARSSAADGPSFHRGCVARSTHPIWDALSGARPSAADGRTGRSTSASASFFLLLLPFFGDLLFTVDERTPAPLRGDFRLRRCGSPIERKERMKSIHVHSRRVDLHEVEIWLNTLIFVGIVVIIIVQRKSKVRHVIGY